MITYLAPTCSLRSPRQASDTRFYDPFMRQATGRQRDLKSFRQSLVEGPQDMCRHFVIPASLGRMHLSHKFVVSVMG